MLYSSWITRCRNQSGDLRRRRHIDWLGDNTSTIFQIPDDCYPVLDQSGTYVVKVGGVSKSEGSDYTLDKETGTLVFAAAPGTNVTVTIDHSSVRVTDAGWMQITNDVIKSMGDDFYTEFTDSTNLTTTANMSSLSVNAANTRCTELYDLLYRESSAMPWTPINKLCNWRHQREDNTIYFGRSDVFTTTGWGLKIRGLASYALSDTVSDTMPVQDRFHTVLENGCLDRYWQWRYKEVVQLISKMSTETTRTPLQELIMLSDRYHRLFLDEKNKLKPMKPAYRIPNHNPHGGHP